MCVCVMCACVCMHVGAQRDGEIRNRFQEITTVYSSWIGQPITVAMLSHHNNMQLPWYLIVY